MRQWVQRTALEEMYLALCLPNQRGIPVSGPGRGQAVNFSDSCYKQSLSGGGCDLTPFSQREAGEQKDRASLSLYVILCLGKRRSEISTCGARVDIFMVNQSRQSRAELLWVAVKFQGDFFCEGRTGFSQVEKRWSCTMSHLSSKSFHSVGWKMRFSWHGIHLRMNSGTQIGAPVFRKWRITITDLKVLPMSEVISKHF